MAVAIHVVYGIFDDETLFQGWLDGRDIERQVLGDVIVPLFDCGAEVVVLECRY